MKTGKKKWIIGLCCIIIFVLFNMYVLTFGITMGHSLNIPEYSFVLKYKLPVILYKLDQQYRFPLKRGEVISFWNDERGNVAKRIVGLPGEKISYREGNLYVNDELVSEPYLNPGQKDDCYLAPFHLQEDEVWVMGDNRIDSYDSRMFGPLNLSQITGKLIYAK